MKRAALDTKFVLAYSASEADTAETLEYLKKSGFELIITESVVEQLAELIRDKQNPSRDFALYAFWMHPSWEVSNPANPYVEHGTSCRHAEKIIEQGLVPGATKIEAEILVEASCHQCDLLVTFSQPLLKSDTVPLNLALVENDMNAVTVAIASPAQIAARLPLLEKNNATQQQQLSDKSSSTVQI